MRWMILNVSKRIFSFFFGHTGPLLLLFLPPCACVPAGDAPVRARRERRPGWLRILQSLRQAAERGL